MGCCLEVSLTNQGKIYERQKLAALPVLLNGVFDRVAFSCLFEDEWFLMKLFMKFTSVSPTNLKAICFS